MRLLPRLVLLMTLVAAVPLGLAGWSAIRISRSVTRDQVGEAHQRLAENLAESIASFESEEVQALGVATRSFDFERLSPEERHGALQLLFLQMPSADLLAMVDGKGYDLADPVAFPADQKAAADQAHRATRTDADLEAFRVRLLSALARKEGPLTSGLYDEHSARGPHQAIAVAAGGGRYLAAEISFEKVRAQLTRFHLGSGGVAFLVDDHGRIEVHPDASHVGEDIAAQPFIAARLTDPVRESAAGEMVDRKGVPLLAAWAPVGRWGLVVSQPTVDAMRASTSIFKQTFVWVVVSLLFAVVLAGFYAREVSRPIEEAAEGARKLASGDLAHRLRSTAGDEIGDLARAFDEMAGKLQKSLEEVERQNQEIRGFNATLLQKVDDRTRALRETQAELVQSKKLAALAELGAGLAHELNNPLAAINGFAQLLMLSVKPEDKNYKALHTIDEQSRRCADIVSRLLRYSEEASEHAREKVEVNAAVVDALEVVEQRIKDEKIDIVRAFGEGLPPIHAAPGELREVFWHILSNARNAMPRGGTLAVSTWCEGDPVTGTVKIRFKDTGRGIAPENLDRIFEPFFTTKDEWRGTGLGLAVVHRIVTDHGGTIAVESVPGEGASFTLLFPMAPAEARTELTPSRAMRVKTQLV